MATKGGSDGKVDDWQPGDGSLRLCIMETLFWISLFLLFYSYIGYGILLVVYNALRRKKSDFREDFQPPVTLLVPAFNEETVIQAKIENSLALDYPPEKISFLFITDGSDDATDLIIGRHREVRLLHHPERRGKAAAINRAMKEVTTPITIFTDANTMLHPQSIKKLTRHFSNEKAGGVSGEKQIRDKTASAVGLGEQLYWQYESLLKKANAGFYTIIGAAGELFAIRTALFRPLPETIILDDFVISARICQDGYRFLYEDQAIAVETSSSNLTEERKRKIRISAGCFQALLTLTGLLNPLRNFRVSFQYLSHRVLRWVLCPVLLPLLFITSGYLFLQSGEPIYTFLFLAQVAFYLLAITGLAVPPKKARQRFFLVPSYFVFMIFAQYAGFHRFLRKKQTVLWEKANRKSLLI